MDENPYEPPSCQETRPGAKAVAGLSVLTLLSIPAAAIAGSVTCAVLSNATRSLNPVILFAAVFACLTVIIAALTFEQHRKGGLTADSFFAAVGRVALLQLAITPLAAVLAIAGGVLFYDLAERRILRGNYVGIVLGAIVNLVWSVTAYRTWRSWFSRRGTDGPNSVRWP